MTQFGMQTDFDVVVIGAGAAGLAATKAVLDAGHKVICLEAGNRIGGRAHTDRDIFGLPFDIGAHWLHTETANPFIEIGKSMGLHLYPQHLNGYTHGDETARIWNIVEQLTARMSDVARSGKDQSLWDLYDGADDWAPAAALMLTLSMGRDMPRISAIDWTLSLDAPDWFCRQGFGTIVARRAGDLPVTLNAPVHAIRRLASGVLVETATGAVTAKTAIVTVSQGVLAAETIRFDPPLENNRLTAISGITMGLYNHVALLFSPDTLPVRPDTWVTYKVPPPDAAGVLRGGGMLCNVSGTGLSVFEHSGTFAREIETAGDQAAIDFALSRLVEIFGADIRHSFIKGHATQWGQNPFTRGSYSGAIPGATLARAALTQPHADVIHFAGEATHHEEMATVSGAHKSGMRAADAAIAQL